ncbi:hypothetical protein Hypma_005085 [Hypsizygus marmoreus]|uniref:Uncharacterized protein n=1 Tax=Hypsizygus marmoreus TaxID=39966 RepID=A0A369K0I2_HYPMA|nr:hypothetical protein Hypma_005085 [Hypsizygus marmoreus]
MFQSLTSRDCDCTVALMLTGLGLHRPVRTFSTSFGALDANSSAAIVRHVRAHSDSGSIDAPLYLQILGEPQDFASSALSLAWYLV